MTTTCKEIIRRPLVDDNNLPNTLHPIIKQIYARRGIKNEDELSLNLPKLLPLELLSGLKEGCEILFDAFAQQKKSSSSVILMLMVRQALHL